MARSAFPFAFSSALFLGACWLWGHGLPMVPSVATMAEADLAAIEPAEGHEAPAAEGHGASAEGEKGGEAANGKDLTGAKLLPKVVIAGAPVETKTDLQARLNMEAVPKEIQGPKYQWMLDQRNSLVAFAHNPTRGPMVAPVTIFEFTSLGCTACMPALQRADALVEPLLADKVRFISMAMTAGPSLSTDLPAFYGKVAQAGGHFWDYRKALETLVAPSPNAYFDALISTGIDRVVARRLMTTEARRFYREIDADSRLAKGLGLDNPPHYYVNGIHVGTGSLPLENLPQVLAYEQKRLALLDQERANE